MRRQNEFYAKSESDKEKIEFLRNKLEERKALFQTATKDLLDKRAQLKTKEANFQHAIRQVQLENQVLENQLAEISKKAVNEAENC